jgi:hypothetical protein
VLHAKDAVAQAKSWFRPILARANDQDKALEKITPLLPKKKKEKQEVTK